MSRKPASDGAAAPAQEPEPGMAANSGDGQGEGGAPGDDAAEAKGGAPAAGEIGGPKGPEPTRYGDWEVGGRCTDF